MARARFRGSAERTCIVCGHNLGPYGRICDKCGSIQRPVHGDGLPLPPDKFKACEQCGQPMPIEIPEDICEECASVEEPHPVVWVDDIEPHRKGKLAAKISSGVALAATGGVSLAMIFAGANVGLIVILAITGVALGASIASWIVISRRPAHKIEYYEPVKPEKRGERPRAQTTR